MIFSGPPDGKKYRKPPYEAGQKKAGENYNGIRKDLTKLEKGGSKIKMQKMFQKISKVTKTYRATSRKRYRNG